MSQSVYSLKESREDKILREFHFHAPEINEEVHGQLPTITSKAKIFIKQTLEKEDSFFRFGVSGGGCSGFNYLMNEDIQLSEDDIMFCDSPKAVIDSISLKYLYGSIIDISDKGFGKTLVVDNPGAKQSCGCGTSFSFDPDLWNGNF